MLALDQMEGGGLPSGDVVPLLSSSDPILRDTASWLVSRHVEWGGALSGYFRTRLEAIKSVSHDSAVADEMARFSTDPAIQDLLAQTARSGQTQASRITALRAMAAAPLKETPESWAEALTAALTSSDDDLLREAVSTAESLPQGDKRDAALDRALVDCRTEREPCCRHQSGCDGCFRGSPRVSVSCSCSISCCQTPIRRNRFPFARQPPRALSGAPLDSEQHVHARQSSARCRSAGAAGLAARIRAGGRRGTRRGLDGVA